MKKHKGDWLFLLVFILCGIGCFMVIAGFCSRPLRRGFALELYAIQTNGSDVLGLGMLNYGPGELKVATGGYVFLFNSVANEDRAYALSIVRAEGTVPAVSAHYTMFTQDERRVVSDILPKEYFDRIPVGEFALTVFYDEPDASLPPGFFRNRVRSGTRHMIKE